MASPNFAPDAPKESATPPEALDAVVERLATRADAWVRTPIERRIELLRACIEHTEGCATEWVEAACMHKGIDPQGPRAGEEWLGGPVTTLRNLRLLIEALEAGGQPEATLTQRPDGQWVAQVFPQDVYDKLLFTGFSAEVWIEKGKAPTQGAIYRRKAEGDLPAGKVSLVLGAGNVASIGPMDALHKLFVEDEVVVVKTNPVNAYLKPYWEEAFAPLKDEGFFAVVTGGAKVGSHLVHHPKIATIHMTGSDRTHDAIVFGGDPAEQARRKASGERLVDKPISSELGAVTPVFVVPGPWSDADIDYHARQVASMVTNNASFNCNAAKVLVLASGWPQREVFLDRLEKALSTVPARRAYYPGAEQRYEAFLEHYPDAKPLGERLDGVVPWTLIPEVPLKKGEYALTNEAFCGVLALTEIQAADAGAYLSKMAEVGNDICWGTLSCMILVHPDTERQYRQKFDEAVASLRYGGIAINVWAGVIYGLVSPTWGAFPGHPLEDIQSGRGVVHNTHLFDHPERSIVRGPFRIRPTPVWFADHRTGHEVGAALARFEASPSPIRLPALLYAAMRG